MQAEDPNDLIWFQINHGHGDRCYHRGVIVSTRTRKVNCKVCGKDVDPFDALAEIVRDWERYERRAAELRAEYEQELRRLEETKRLVSNAKAQLRRARG